MIATSEIEYPPGKLWKPGDLFEVEEAHAKLLETLGRAKLPEGDDATASATVLQLATVAERRPRGRPPKAQ